MEEWGNDSDKILNELPFDSPAQGLLVLLLI